MKKPLTLQQQKSLFVRARHVYYTDPDGNTIMTDAEFDALEDNIRRLAPDWHVLKTTGHSKKIDTELFAPMPSLSKLYSWPGTTNKGYIITPKFDGTSLQLVYDKGVPIGLYTRGNGMVGGDVSFILPFLNIPKRIPFKGELIVRCEGIMDRKVFAKRWKKSDKNPHGYAMARAAVNGQFNRTVDELDLDVLADTELIVVAVYGKRADQMYDFARKQGFKVAPELKLDAEITHEGLCGLIQRLRDKFPYDTDGLVLTMRHITYHFDDASLPAFAHAFKMNLEGVQTKVRKVIWQISRFGRWTPVIMVDEVDFDGYKVTRAVAHNAKWMQEKGVGVGALVELIRGGEIIPKIEKVIKRAAFNPPEGKTEYRGRHLYALENGEAATQAQNIAIEHFIAALGIKDISEKGIEALMKKGVKDVLDLLLLARGENGQKKLAFLFGANGSKLHIRLTKLMNDGVPLIVMAASSGVMPPGVGRRKLEEISKVMPLKSLLTAEPQDLFEWIQTVDGIAEKSARMIVKGCKGLREMARKYKAAGIKLVLEPTKAKATSAKYSGIVAAFTGYRDPGQEAAITAGGGEVGSLTKKTTHLFYNPDGRFQAKVEKARKEGKKVMTWAAFMKGK